MSTTKKAVKIPSELPITAKTQSPLCFLHSEILRAYIGEQGAYVYSVLHSRRKQTIGELSKKTGLSIGSLKKLLTVLIQLGCAVYIKNERTGAVSYAHNEEGCWKLTFADDIVRHIREKFGDNHAGVMQNVLLGGHVTIGSYVKEIELKSEIEMVEQSFLDLIEDGWLIHVKGMDFTTLSENFANCVRLANREFMENSSQYTRSDDMGMGGGGGNPRFKSAGLSQLKKTMIIKDIAKEKFLKLYYDNSGKEQLYRVGISNNKRSEGSSMTTLFSDDEDADEQVDDGSKKLKRINGSIPLSVSFERYLKYSRDTHLVSISRHRIGNVSAMVYEVVLDRIEKSTRDMRNVEHIVDRLVADASVGAGSAGSSTSGYDPSTAQDLKKRLELADQQKGMNFGAADILKALSLTKRYELTKDDLLGTIMDNEEDDDVQNSRKRKLEESEANGYKKSKLSKLAAQIKTFDEDEDEEEDADGKNNQDNGFDINGSSSETAELLKLILHHLKLLTTDTKLSFLIETTPGQFYVPFTVLQQQLSTYHKKQLIKCILGNASLRVYNCIESKRLAEEKTIAKSVLMKEGDVRRVIATLTRFGLIEIQEIPRTTDRSAMRSIFAFKLNRTLRSSRMLANCLLFNAGEVLSGVEERKDENKILLAKLSRTDVKGHESELLLPSELEQLNMISSANRADMARLQRLRHMGVLFWFTETV